MNEPKITLEQIHIRIVYIRFRGSYVEFRKNSRRLFQKLYSFASKHNLVFPDTTKVLTLYNDNPYITSPESLRTSIAMTVPMDSNIIEEDEICSTTISGKFAVGHFHLSPNEYENAWKYMYYEWLFKGKEKPRDAIPFELYVTEPPKNSKGKSYTDIYIPIE